jgi:hypothetical protein
MPELKHLRGVRVQEYDEEDWLQDAAEDARPVHPPVVALADRREGRAPRAQKPRRANTSRRLDPDPATRAT